MGKHATSRKLFCMGDGPLQGHTLVNENDFTRIHLLQLRVNLTMIS